jgi:hypothetical protein
VDYVLHWTLIIASRTGMGIFPVADPHGRTLLARKMME